MMIKYQTSKSTLSSCLKNLFFLKQTYGENREFNTFLTIDCCYILVKSFDVSMYFWLNKIFYSILLYSS